MASIKEIRERMKSIQETMKITNAMYLIASSKLKKARKQLQDVEPFFRRTQSTISEILACSPEIEHPYFDLRTDVTHKKCGYLVISADKGLSGSYNHNVLKFAEACIEQTADPAVFLVGRMGQQYFERKKVMIDAEFLYMAQDPSVYNARTITETLLEHFQKGRLDEVYVIYTEMVSSLRQEPRVIKLLPLDKNALASPEAPAPEKKEYRQIAAYVPSTHAVLDRLVPNYIKGIVYGALVESFASLQSARMTAMDNSTKNAKEIIKNLSLLYNRARQAAITQEISEIVGGAEALSK